MPCSQYFNSVCMPTIVLGFLCPVHTPDGGPCGLLNHATAHCEVQSL